MTAPSAGRFTPEGRFGSFTVETLLGVGGMGHVYRAHDSKLGRKVALKMLPPGFGNDADRLARFEREARVLASLNHPHIAAIYGIEEAHEVRALVLELVDGETLAEKLRQGPLPLADCLLIARQIAEALEAAHERGIVHRDLKPANIKITTARVVKVLDFGLAKAVAEDRASAGLAADPATTAVATHDGVIVGTPGYMSPEQARGNTVDRRTDIWAFGAVLYELLAGRSPFGGGTTSDVLAHVLTKDPDWTALPADTPPLLRRLLRRCLEKVRERRLDSATALKLEIEDLLAGPTPDTAPPAASRLRWRRVGLGAAVVAVTAVVVAGALLQPLLRGNRPSSSVTSQFLITLPAEQPLGITPEFRDLAISPDGRYLVYHTGPPSGGGGLIVRALDELEPRQLAGVRSAHSPFFSADSQWIGFFEGGTMKKVAVTGGPVITVNSSFALPQSASWSEDGTFIVSELGPNKGLLRVPANGGDATAVTTTDAAEKEIAHTFPSALPRNRGILFTAKRASGAPLIVVLDARTGQRKTLFEGLAPEFVETGHLVYQASGTLFAVEFDLERLELRGEPVPLNETLRLVRNATPKYAVSRTGTVAFALERLAVSSLLWVDRKGRETPIEAPPRSYNSLQLSPDGGRIAVQDDRDIWVWDLAKENFTRLTFDASAEMVPIWTPDGRSIVFMSDRSGVFNLYRQAADGSGGVERLTESQQSQYPNSVTPDGTAVLGAELFPQTGFDIIRVPAVAPTAANAAPLNRHEVIVATRSGDYAARISPDGSFLAYQSAESGRFEIYVQPYGNLTRGRWQVSTGGGVAPVWAHDGRELFYFDQANALTVVPIVKSPTSFNAGRPVKLLEKSYAGDFHSYDVSPDGQRFLVREERTLDRAGQPSVGVVVAQHWLDELASRPRR